MNILVPISRQDVYEAVYATTAMLGHKSEQFDKITATEDNVPVLEKYYLKAMGDLASSQSKVNAHTSKDGIIITTRTNFDTCVIPLLSQTYCMYLVNSITSQWLSNISVEMAQTYEGAASDIIKNINSVLNTRRRPR